MDGCYIMHLEINNAYISLLILLMITVNTIAIPAWSISSNKVENTRIKYQTLTLPVRMIPTLVNAKINAVKDVAVCYNGEIYTGNIWLLPDRIAKSNLYGLNIELPVIDRENLKPDDVLIMEIPVINNTHPQEKCPWGLNHALARLHKRIKVDIETRNSHSINGEYSLYIYYDDKMKYDRHLAIAPLPIIKKIAKKLGIDYHDISSLKNRLTQINSMYTSIKDVKVETMDKFVFSKDYSKLLNDPVTGYPTYKALEICPSCPVMDGGGSNLYDSELYFYLTNKESGGIIMPSTSNTRNASKIYLGRGGNIEKISLYIVGSSTSDNDDSTLYLSLTFQENINNRLRDRDAWANITTKHYYITLEPEPTYRVIEVTSDQLDLQPNKYYKVIVEFQWVYGSQPYLYSAIIGIKKLYSSTTLQNVPGDPPATTHITQLRTIGEYFKPSTPNPTSITIILKPLSGAVSDEYTLYSSVNVHPDWEKSLTASITFYLKVYVNGILRRTFSFTLQHSEDKDLTINLPIYRSDFFYKGALWVTYELERMPTDVYGDFSARAYVSSDVFIDVWDVDNPYPYLEVYPPKLQQTTLRHIMTDVYNRTILSTIVLEPIGLGRDCDAKRKPDANMYYFIYDNGGINSWSLTIASDHNISIEHRVDIGNEAPYITYMLNGLIIGFNIFLTYVTSGLELLPQIIIQLITSTAGDMVSLFISKITTEEISVKPDEATNTTWHITYNAPLLNYRTGLSLKLHIEIDPGINDICDQAPLGFITELDITSSEPIYFTDEHTAIYILMYNYNSTPGYPEPSNWDREGTYGIRYG